VIEYLKFWLAQFFLQLLVAGIALAILFGAAFWNLQGKKFYEEPKHDDDPRRQEKRG
jgi:hypothetical protein